MKFGPHNPSWVFGADPYTVFQDVKQIVDIVGHFQDIGVQMFIASVHKNDRASLELLASQVMPHFI